MLATVIVSMQSIILHADSDDRATVHDLGAAAVLVKNEEMDLMPVLLTLLSCF